MSERIKLFTIGFSGKSACYFFTCLRRVGVRRVMDIRLKNRSQLAGFAKYPDLEFFCHAVNDMEYLHLPQLAPSQEILAAYKKEKGSWADYERAYLALLADRKPEAELSVELLDRSCLLCSEASPAHCHRRLLAEYLIGKMGEMEIIHLE